MSYEYKQPTVRQLLEAINREFKQTIDEAEKPKGGMQVPFHGDFCSVIQLPSVICRMRWWVREFDRALAEENENNDEKEAHIDTFQDECVDGS